MIHRDFNARNVFLDSTMTARVGDFGLARVAPELLSEQYIETRYFCGSLCYVDPEYMATGRLSPAVDVYAFGWFLFEVLTGRRTVGEKGDHLRVAVDAARSDASIAK